MLTEINLRSFLRISDGLKNLTYLDLTHNQMIIVPPSINKLISLRELRLPSNKIKVLPDEISKLEQLKS